MRFKQYSKTIHGIGKDIAEKIPRASREGEWVVQEKVKGVPFSLWIDKKEQRGACKHRFLREDEPYFNWRSFHDNIAPKLRNILNRVKANEIVVYGELYGGVYPGVEDHAGSIPLNRGVFYAAHNDWFVFDMVIDGMWQPQWYMYQLFDEIGVNYAYEIMRGSFRKVIRFNPSKYLSEIHELHNLPPIQSNICSGIVIRPLEPTFLFDGRRLLICVEN